MSATAPRRGPDTLPDPGRPAGTADATMPFDHIVVVMMENHSFDNVLGGLSRAGQPRADGLSFDHEGRPTNTNTGATGTPSRVTAFPFSSTAQGTHVTQTWDATHVQIDGGRMDGFVRSVDSTQPMGYYPPEVLPFAHSLAAAFTLANRWFSSAPCMTFPNRRFLMAGTAYGSIASSIQDLFDGSPPNGTIFDRLSAHGIGWREYFTDVPQTVLIPSVIERHPLHIKPIDEFHSDCANGSLPAVSFVTPEVGAISALGTALTELPVLGAIGHLLQPLGGSQEEPQDMYYGELWAYRVVQSVLESPLWARTLLIYTYDEHGGYYDHVPPPPAIEPDAIPPKLDPGDAPGGYDIYGVRVPAVVVSPYARPNSVTDVIHDHTSVLATIEAKWNLPALTFRDANAATIVDFLDTAEAALLDPPELSAPSPIGPSGPVG